MLIADLASRLLSSFLLHPCRQPADREIPARPRFDYINARPLENDPVAGIVCDVQQAGGQGVLSAQGDTCVGAVAVLGSAHWQSTMPVTRPTTIISGLRLKDLRCRRRDDVGRFLAVDARIRNLIHPADHQSDPHDHRGYQVGEREAAHRGVKRRDGGIQRRRGLDDDRGGRDGRCVDVQRRMLAGACLLPLAKMQTQVEIVEIELPRGRVRRRAAVEAARAARA